MKLYFLRHGESTANVAREFWNGDGKHPLTERGLDQAREAARRLNGLAPERIYSSPVLRALQTAQILSQSLHAPVQVAEALREWSVGIYEGRTDPRGWEAHRQVQDLWFNQQQLDARMPGGESFRDIQARFVPFVEQAAGNESDRSIVAVGHGGLYMAMLPVVLRNISFAFVRQRGFANAGYVVAETRHDGLYCLSWCGEPVDEPVRTGCL